MAHPRSLPTHDRRRAALSLQRFGSATTFAARLLSAPMPAEATAAAAASREARQLLRDIHRRVAEVRRSNKRLAKELSEVRHRCGRYASRTLC